MAVPPLMCNWCGFTASLCSSVGADMPISALQVLFRHPPNAEQQQQQRHQWQRKESVAGAADTV